MQSHVLFHTNDIPKETNVAQLVYFIVTNGLVGKLFLNIFHIVMGSGNGGNARAGETDFRGGSKFIHHIGIACFFAFIQNFNKFILNIIIQMMNAVSVIPENSKIFGGGFEPSKTANHFIRIGVTGGVGIFGNTPNPLNGFIFCHQLFNHIHIGAVFMHGNVNHFNAEILGNGKMTVVPGNGAQEFHFIQFAPGGAAHNPVGHGAGNGIVHHVKGRVAVNNNVIHRNFHHIPNECLGFGNAVQNPVVAAIGTVFTGKVGSTGKYVHHTHGKVQLFGTGFPTSHIQFQVAALVFFVLSH